MSADCVRFDPPLTKQKYDRLFVPCVIHSVARAEVDSQLPHTVLTELVVAEVSVSDAINSPLDNDSPF
jgi:hypothetical protein